MFFKCLAVAIVLLCAYAPILPQFLLSSRQNQKDANAHSLLASVLHQRRHKIPLSTRIYWMRRTNSALEELSSPCPFAAFGSAIVNHTDTMSLGQLICIGANSNAASGNPTLHGEIAAIDNCTEVLRGPGFSLSHPETLAAFKTLSFYTNAESCPMYASAIRWAGFREYIYGTSIDALIDQGWGQIKISSKEVFDKSTELQYPTAFIGSVLSNETDPYFAWQFNKSASCPDGCHRAASNTCMPEAV